MMESKTLFSSRINCYYYPELGHFKDEAGRDIVNIYPLVDPLIVALFRTQKHTMTFFNPQYRLTVTLFYPDKTFKNCHTYSADRKG